MAPPSNDVVHPSHKSTYGSYMAAHKPLHRQIVKMLDETFHYNNKLLHLSAAYHKMPRASLEYILTKVRQNLIQDFQRIYRKIPKERDEIKITDVESESKKKKVFVTYAWENEEFNSKILSFVEFLRRKGFDASMDKKKVKKNQQ